MFPLQSPVFSRPSFRYSTERPLSSASRDPAAAPLRMQSATAASTPVALGSAQTRFTGWGKLLQLPSLTFGRRANEPPADLRLAWQTPALRRSMEYVFRGDLFRDAPALGVSFIEKIDELTQSDKTNDEIFKGLRTYFMEIASTPEIKLSFKLHTQERCERRARQVVAILNEVQPGKAPGNLLDVGSGNGVITSLLGDKLNLPKDKVLAAEIIAEPNPPANITQLVFDGSNLPLKGDSIDLALLLSVLHHAEDFQPLLKDIHRSMKPDGCLIVREFNAPSAELQLLNLVMDHLFYRVFSDEPDVPNPGHFFSQEKWMDLFKKIGFKIEKLIHPEPPEVNPYQPFMAVLKKEVSVAT